MNRRDYLTGLIPLTAVSAGFSILGQSEPRDLWTVSVDSVDIDEIDLTVEVRRKTATTEELATVWVEFTNTLDDPIRFVYLRGHMIAMSLPGWSCWPQTESPNANPMNVGFRMGIYSRMVGYRRQRYQEVRRGRNSSEYG